MKYCSPRWLSASVLSNQKPSKGAATDKATSANIPLEKKTTRVWWQPTTMPRIAAEDFILSRMSIALKPRVMVDLKAIFNPEARRHQGSCGSSKHWSRLKTTDVMPEGHQLGAANQATKNPATRGTCQQEPPTPKILTLEPTSSNTPDHGASMLQAVDFPHLTDVGAGGG
ncbi:hypothetical protein MRX96_009628 [Rhipicephalus microplus]